jgi:hypothetical protein
MRALPRTLLSGAAGTLCEAALTVAERRLLGRPPYDTAEMAKRLAAQLGVELDADAARVAGVAMHWTYGPAWGIAAELASRRMRWPLAGATVGSLLFAVELVLLPRTGATPRLGGWGARFVAADLANAMTFGVVAALTTSLLARAETVDG